MYVAKADHSGVFRYDALLDDYDPHRLAVVGELRRALREDELVLHFQPKVRLSDGSITSVEALIRWQHPTRGLLSPDDFLPVAEQTGLIDDLTTWVIDSALTQAARWSDMGRPLAVAVNVSARNLCRPSFARQVIAQLEAHSAHPSTLLVEITETALMSDIDRALANLATLTAHGVQVSLDDFGKGQTSLGYLHRLPLYELKIDRAFVTDMSTHVSNAAIVRSVVDLAHDLGFRVVAEGVEDELTLDQLRGLGCDYAQGYFITRPQTFDSLTLWLEGRRTVGLTTA
jgi:EAL domain-containing protein (putative c-di-GMP-specific phosphodiesterase class I)